MSSENDSEISTTFSTLNVNAVEFIPSFVVAPREASAVASEPTAEEPSEQSAPTIACKWLFIFY